MRAKIPYFVTKLKTEWSGAGWNMNNPLDVHLPCPVDRPVVDVYLRFAYGDATLLQETDASDAAFLQVSRPHLKWASDFRGSKSTFKESESCMERSVWKFGRSGPPPPSV